MTFLRRFFLKKMQVKRTHAQSFDRWEITDSPGKPDSVEERSTTTHTLVGEKTNSADTCGMGALSMSSFEASLTPPELPEIKKTKQNDRGTIKKFVRKPFKGTRGRVDWQEVKCWEQKHNSVTPWGRVIRLCEWRNILRKQKKRFFGPEQMSSLLSLWRRTGEGEGGKNGRERGGEGREGGNPFTAYCYQCRSQNRPFLRGLRTGLQRQGLMSPAISNRVYWNHALRLWVNQNIPRNRKAE